MHNNVLLRSHFSSSLEARVRTWSTSYLPLIIVEDTTLTELYESALSQQTGSEFMAIEVYRTSPLKERGKRRNENNTGHFFKIRDKEQGVMESSQKGRLFV